MIEQQLLNAIIATRDYSTLVRHGLADAHYFREQHAAFEYIRDHVSQYGETPSVHSVVEHVERLVSQKKPGISQFEPVDVVESVDTLCIKLKAQSLKLDIKDALTQLAKDYATQDGYQLLTKIRDSSDALYRSYIRDSAGGANWATNGDDRLAEFQSRKAMDFGRNLPLMFDELTKAVGGAERGDVVTIMAFTGKGKSWLGLLESLATNREGYRTTVESVEMTKAKCLFRLDTLDMGFSNRGLWTGQLTEADEKAYKEYLAGFRRDSGRPDLIIRTPEDWPHGLTLEQLEADIDQTGCDVVVVDQFNLMTFNGNDRNAKTALSRQLKQLAQRKKVVIVMLYQTSGEYEKTATRGEDGIRQLKLPRLSDYSETIALIQDSSIVIGFDAVMWDDEATGRKRGKALIGVLKGRDGGEGTELELEWLPNDGIIRPRVATDTF